MHIMEYARPFRNARFRPEDEVVPGVRFGRPEWVPTPAFWAALADQQRDEADDYVSPVGTPLLEDVAFCLLGGYGIKMEVNRAAWERLNRAGVFAPKATPSRDEIEALLSEPLLVDGRRVKYRFPRQRADRLAVALSQLREAPPQTDDPLAFREHLMTLPGIGPKTASWIVRNWSGSDAVAILDVHVLRAGTIIGLFPSDYRLPRDYVALERRFLAFASALQVPASFLDALIWREMRVLVR
jgi:thermostable 8-oxoguanine DNA glycosylase